MKHQLLKNFPSYIKFGNGEILKLCYDGCQTVMEVFESTEAAYTSNVNQRKAFFSYQNEDDRPERPIPIAGNGETE